MGIDDEIMLRWTRVGGEQTKQILGVDDVTVENVLPAVTSVSVPANATYKTGDPLDFTVMWNEAVAFHTANGTPSFDLTIGSTVRKAVYLIRQRNQQYGFSIHRAVRRIGQRRRECRQRDRPQRRGHHRLVGACARDPYTERGRRDHRRSVGATTGVLVEAVPPQVTSVGVPSSATYTAVQGLAFTVNWDEPVTVTGAPSIPLTVGSTTRQAVYQSGSGSAALVFRYTVQSGDNDADGVALGSAISLNSGTIEDWIGNDAVLTLTSAGATTGVLVDAKAPAVGSVDGPAAGSCIAPVRG